MNPKSIVHKPGTKVYKEHKLAHPFEVQEQAKLIYEKEAWSPLVEGTAIVGD